MQAKITELEKKQKEMETKHVKALKVESFG